MKLVIIEKDGVILVVEFQKVFQRLARFIVGFFHVVNRHRFKMNPGFVISIALGASPRSFEG